MFKEKYFRYFEWVMFFGLCGLSIYFMHGVLEQYQSNDTSFKHSELPIEVRPTVVVCFTKIFENEKIIDFTEKYKIGKDFIIAYQSQNLDVEKNIKIHSGLKFEKKVQFRETSPFTSKIKINVFFVFFQRECPQGTC